MWEWLLLLVLVSFIPMSLLVGKILFGEWIDWIRTPYRRIGLLERLFAYALLVYVLASLASLVFIAVAGIVDELPGMLGDEEGGRCC